MHDEGFQRLTTVEDAKRILFDTLGPAKVRKERIPVEKARVRVLAVDITSDRYLPPADRSVVDGFAVRSDDVQLASEDTPVVLHVIGESKIGYAPPKRIGKGEAVVAATGSILPGGADAVVMVERTKRIDKSRVAIYASVNPGQGVSKKGEDIVPGNLVFPKGSRLRPEDLGILKALGLRRVTVASKPKVAVLSTGNELTDSTIRRGLHKVADLNRPVLSAMVEELGGSALDVGIARDDEHEILGHLRKAWSLADMVLVSAGSSVGKKDLVPECINKLGRPGMLVHGVAMRPALPTGLAVVKGKPIVSLPGFPVSAIVAFRAFAKPLLSRMLGAREPGLFVKARLVESVEAHSGLRTFIRVAVRMTPDGYVAEPLKVQRSSVLMSIVQANGIITIPENIARVEAGQLVDVEVTGEISV